MAALCWISACSQTPVYQTPSTPATGEFKSALVWKQTQTDADTPKLINDETLNALQQQVKVNNQSLKANAAQLKVAQAALQAARAPLLPSLTINAAANRSANSFNSPRGTSYSFNGAAANWEIDLWGRVSGQVDAAQANLQASEFTLAAAKLSVHATVVQTYFAFRFTEAQIALLERSVQAYEKSLELTHNRHQSGVATLADVAQAVAQLKTAESQTLALRTQSTQLENALAGLAGKAMADFSLTQAAKLPEIPAVPTLLQSTWVERRPDIAAAERQVAAANHQLGVTRAAFFPTLTLSATGGYRGPSLGDLIAAPNQVWSIGPLLSYAAFDNGVRRAANAQALANLELVTANYRQTVLTSLQELEDNLVAAHHLREQALLQWQAKTASEEVLRISTNQYKAGTVSYLNVVLAQTNALNAELAWLNLKNLQLAATNTLLKNTAGALPPQNEAEPK
ncbi:MAG: efflux transporter outer membrane subunit [Burkholderiales bacterium]|nr:efflux transporter outer membrane subunit [Burkholderiales bacterium]